MWLKQDVKVNVARENQVFRSSGCTIWWAESRESVFLIIPHFWEGKRVCSIAALIFSAGYYSAPNFFFTSSNFFSLYHFAAFSAFCVKSFDFSRLVSLFSHSAKSVFKHQLLSKAIQNEQSQNKKLKSEIEKPIKPNFRCPLFEHRSYKS